MFWNNQEISKNSLKIKELELDLLKQKAITDELQQKFKQLRGLLNRKLGIEDKENAEVIAEKVKYSDGFDMLRGL